MTGAKGFTLLEMLVALAVLSLGILALVNVTGESTRTAGVIEARTFAGVVAENRVIEALLASVPPPLGETAGSDELASRRWHWTRKVSETPDPGILRLDVAVGAEDSAQILSAVTVFRGR